MSVGQCSTGALWAAPTRGEVAPVCPTHRLSLLKGEGGTQFCLQVQHPCSDQLPAPSLAAPANLNNPL